MDTTDLRGHLVAHVNALLALEGNLDRLRDWGERLGTILVRGGRLLACGNGGSAAEAQHLAAELVGRYSTERRPLSAIALTSDIPSLTAIANDYGWREALARQVLAHGRPGDVLIAFSTSGRSENVLAAVRAASSRSMSVWGLTGPAPNPLQRLCHESVAAGGSTAVCQELHLVAIHLLCAVVDGVVAAHDARELREAG